MVQKLIEEITKKNAPVVAGLDPMLSYVPEHIQKKAFDESGETLEGAAEAIWQFNKGIIDAIYDLVPAVKPQIAMYEQFGIPGMEVFSRTVSYCKEKGLVVIGDKAFYDTEIKTLKLPEGITGIKFDMLDGMVELESITVPSSKESMYKEQFNEYGIEINVY